MTPNRFRRLLEAYGADIERWPPAERVQARLLVAQDPRFLRQVIGRARMLDDWLDGYNVPSPSPALAARIAEQAMTVPLPEPAPRATEQAMTVPLPEPAPRATEQSLILPPSEPASRATEQSLMLPPLEPASRTAKTAMASSVRRPPTRRGAAGWVGIGLAGIGLAGMLAGAVAFSAMFNLTASESHHDGLSDNSDVFGVNIAEWSD